MDPVELQKQVAEDAFGPAILIRIAAEVSATRAGVEYLKEARLHDQELRRQMKAEHDLAMSKMQTQLDELTDEHDKRIDVLEKDKIKLFAFTAGLGASSAAGVVALMDWIKNNFHTMAVPIAYVLLS